MEAFLMPLSMNPREVQGQATETFPEVMRKQAKAGQHFLSA